MSIESQHADEQYCYLTTTGRTTGLPREIEIWFIARGDTVYMLSGGGEGAHWVMNIHRNPAVTVRLDDTTYPGSGRFVAPGDDEEEFVRRGLAGKYQDWREGVPLSNWARTALPVAIDLQVEGATT
jgi:deazaflavin-dependent oxidoreductase (nitroreductase family)